VPGFTAKELCFAKTMVFTVPVPPLSAVALMRKRMPLAYACAGIAKVKVEPKATVPLAGLTVMLFVAEPPGVMPPYSSVVLNAPLIFSLPTGSTNCARSTGVARSPFDRPFDKLRDRLRTAGDARSGPGMTGKAPFDRLRDRLRDRREIPGQAGNDGKSKPGMTKRSG
jgi:hypothetical protein